MILIAILFVAMLLNWCYCVSLPIVEISLVMGMIYVIANIEILWQISVALRIVAMLIAIIVIAILCVAVNSYTNNNYSNNSYVDSNNSYSK